MGDTGGHVAEKIHLLHDILYYCALAAHECSVARLRDFTKLRGSQRILDCKNREFLLHWRHAIQVASCGIV